MRNDPDSFDSLIVNDCSAPGAHKCKVCRVGASGMLAMWWYADSVAVAPFHSPCIFYNPALIESDSRTTP